MKNIFVKSLEYVKDNFGNLLGFLFCMILVGAPFRMLATLNALYFNSIILRLFFIPMDIFLSILVAAFLGEIYLAVKEDRDVRYFGGIYVLREYGFSFAKLVILIGIKTILWSLLLIIPGIIKAIEYQRIIPLKLANPELSNQELFALGREQMKGFKLHYLGLNLLAYVLIWLGFMIITSPMIYNLSLLTVFISFILAFVMSFVSNMIVLSVYANFNAEMDKYYE